VTRLESARISEQADENTDKLKFRIVDPPVVPLVPDEPNRMLLFTLVAMLAFGVGVAAAFLLNLLRPVFSSRRDVQSALGLRVLGSVARSFDATLTPWYRRDGVLVTGCLALLIGAYLLNVVLLRVI